MTDKPVTLAVVTGAHGVTGEVRLKLFGDGPDSLKGYGAFMAAGRTLTLKSVRAGPNGAVARFAEIGDRGAAEALRGTELTVPRSALPPLFFGVANHHFSEPLYQFREHKIGIILQARVHRQTSGTFAIIPVADKFRNFR